MTRFFRHRPASIASLLHDPVARRDAAALERACEAAIDRSYTGSDGTEVGKPCVHGAICGGTITSRRNDAVLCERCGRAGVRR